MSFLPGLFFHFSWLHCLISFPPLTDSQKPLGLLLGWLPCLTQTLCLAAMTGNSTTVCGGGAAGFGGGISLGGSGGTGKGGFSTSVGYSTVKGGPISAGTSILRKTTTVKSSSRRY